MLRLCIDGSEMRKPAEPTNNTAKKEEPKAKASKPSNKAGKAANK